MSIYSLEENQLNKVEPTSFGDQKIKERDLQDLLKKDIGVIDQDLLVVGEEFGDWEDSRRRIDLLCVDKEANLVVVELKRTEDGGHMDLQAVRYAAMVSLLPFDRVVESLARYSSLEGQHQDEGEGMKEAKEKLEQWFGWGDVSSGSFGEKVKIILVSAEFSNEITTTVMWLNDMGLDIRCVRMKPYENGKQVLVDVQTIIPLPEAADYQTRIREKKKQEDKRRTGKRTYYDVEVAGREFTRLNQREMMFVIVSALLHEVERATPQKIAQCIQEKRTGGPIFEEYKGRLSAAQVQAQLESAKQKTKIRRFFCKSDKDIFHVGDMTYVLTNQWGDSHLWVELLQKEFPEAGIEIRTAS